MKRTDEILVDMLFIKLVRKREKQDMLAKKTGEGGNNRQLDCSYRFGKE